MCVIIYKPQGLKISKSILSDCWDNNSDGAGVIIPDRCPKVFKGIMKLKHLENILSTLTDKELIVHLRWATHGAKNKENTHPFPCGKDRYLAHNGVMNKYGISGTDGISDSAHFADDMRILGTEALRRLLDSMGQKFALVNRNKITLHGDFHEKNGLKFSNLTWDYSRYYTKRDLIGIPSKTTGTKYPMYSKSSRYSDPFYCDPYGKSDPLDD